MVFIKAAIIGIQLFLEVLKMQQKQLMMLVAVIAVILIAAIVVMMTMGGSAPAQPSWCTAGGKWAWAGPEGNAQVSIVGLESHKGAMMCHGRYNLNTANLNRIVDVWWNEDGSSVDYTIGQSGGNI